MASEVIKMVAQGFALRIRMAIKKDEIAVAAGMLKTASDLPMSNLAAELGKIGRELNGYILPGTKAFVGRDIEEQIAEEVGRQLQLDEPEIIWTATKGASVQNFLAILQEMQEILEESK